MQAVLDADLNSMVKTSGSYFFFFSIFPNYFFIFIISECSAFFFPTIIKKIINHKDLTFDIYVFFTCAFMLTFWLSEPKVMDGRDEGGSEGGRDTQKGSLDWLKMVWEKMVLKKMVWKKMVWKKMCMYKRGQDVSNKDCWNFNPSPQCFLLFHKIIKIIVIQKKPDVCNFLLSQRTKAPSFLALFLLSLSSLSDLNSIHLSVVFIYFLKPHIGQLVSSLFKHSLVQAIYLIVLCPLILILFIHFSYNFEPEIIFPPHQCNHHLSVSNLSCFLFIFFFSFYHRWLVLKTNPTLTCFPPLLFLRILSFNKPHRINPPCIPQNTATGCTFKNFLGWVLNYSKFDLMWYTFCFIYMSHRFHKYFSYVLLIISMYIHKYACIQPLAFIFILYMLYQCMSCGKYSTWWMILTKFNRACHVGNTVSGGDSMTFKQLCYKKHVLVASRWKTCMVTRQLAQHDIIDSHHLVVPTNNKPSPACLTSRNSSDCSIKEALLSAHFSHLIRPIDQQIPSHISCRGNTIITPRFECQTELNQTSPSPLVISEIFECVTHHGLVGKPRFNLGESLSNINTTPLSTPMISSSKTLDFTSFPLL
ncbi:hypothetical protein VP01_431g5 [Puccinia sorghi]|uniref:Uncharacterized protein n=1 Tax=Puccinia sorghi TaxID=27349 RepID=A0A0L6UQ21_9BASI|nr:hypothetical protein VP01_431g5 [Puccinia sorghi]